MTKKKTAAAVVDMLAPSAIDTIPFARIRRAPENVRKTDRAAAVEELAEDIGAHGLLQSLIGYAGDGIDAEAIYIVGGGRRLQALELLHERGRINDAWPVPVLIRSPGEAIELSLSENLARRDMNPADEYTAFAALMAPGNLSPADLARRFGFTERYVKQRLRFASLHPDILSALREGKVSIEAATEYAKADDPELQIEVFRALARGPQYNRDNLWHLKSMLSGAQLREDSMIFRFIDRATYEKEGGGYVEDLFDDGGARRLSKTGLAKLIASRCLEFQAGSRVIANAKRDHPTVTGFVVEPFGLGKAKAPSGYVEIATGWDSAGGQHIDAKEAWKRADALGAPVQVVVCLTEEEPIGEDDDGSPLGVVADYRRDVFFVCKDWKRKIVPPKQPTTYGHSSLTPEQQREQELERNARLWAARLSIPRFNDIPGFEDRVFYENNWLDTHRTRPGEPVTGPKTPSFELRVFVTEEEIAANLEAGRARAIEEREAVERAKAEKEAAREAKVQQEAEAFAAKLAAIRDLDALPAVIMASQYLDDAPSPWFLWASGDYFDLPEDDEDADNAMGVEGLDELADTMAVIGDFYITREDYEAATAVTADEDERELADADA